MFLVNQTPVSVFAINHASTYGQKLNFSPKTFSSWFSIPLCSANLPNKYILFHGDLILVFPLFALRASQYWLANSQFYCKSHSTLLCAIYNIMHLSVTRLADLVLTKFVFQLLRLQEHIPRIQPRGAIFFQITFSNLSGFLLHNETV